MQAKTLKLGILAAAITGLTLGASGESYFTRSAHAQSTPPAVALASTPAIALPNFRGIVEKYGPAVVNISVEGTVKSAAAPGQSPFAQIDPDDPFSDFLRRFGPQFQVPPFGVFTSEFMILTTAIKHYPWAAPILLIALGVAFASMFHKVQGMVFGEPTVKPLSHNPALVPVFVHLGLVLMLGLWIPPYLAEWYRQAARLIG